MIFSVPKECKFTWFDVNDVMPNQGEIVMVCGGVALWDGINWRSYVNDSGRVIEWTVRWWAPVILGDEQPMQFLGDK